jgi:hypothetical protein
MKKHFLLVALFIFTINGITFANRIKENDIELSSSPFRLIQHCAFMHYEFEFNGQSYSGSGIYCLEWFWRTGSFPETGESTNIYVSCEKIGIDATSGDIVTLSDSRIVNFTVEDREYSFLIKAGNYIVDEDRQIVFKGIVQ